MGGNFAKVAFVRSELPYHYNSNTIYCYKFHQMNKPERKTPKESQAYTY